MLDDIFQIEYSNNIRNIVSLSTLHSLNYIGTVAEDTKDVNASYDTISLIEL